MFDEILQSDSRPAGNSRKVGKMEEEQDAIDIAERLRISVVDDLRGYSIDFEPLNRFYSIRSDMREYR